MKNRIFPFFQALMIALLLGFIMFLIGNSERARAEELKSAESTESSSNQPLVAMNDNSNQNQNLSSQIQTLNQLNETSVAVPVPASPITNTVELRIPKKSVVQTLKENTHLSYYVQLLGPNATGEMTETYNPFIESKGPIQSFHAVNLKYNLPKNFAVGATVSGVRHHSKSVETKNGTASNDSALFNPRAYVSFPTLDLKVVNMFNTVAVEFPQSQLSQDNKMRSGLVLSQSFSIKTPSDSKFTGGLMTQVIRYFYDENELPGICDGCDSFPLQTVVMNAAPYVNYIINDRWKLTQTVVFDWDQRGKQTGTTDVNNNLPDRWKFAVNYYPTIKHFSQIGMFVQSLNKMDTKSTILGMDMTFRF